MQEIERRIVSLKLRLAEIDGREQSLHELRRQYRQQLRRAVDRGIYAETSLEMTLHVGQEIQTKADQIAGALKLLDAIRARAQDELQTLSLTKGVEDAKRELAKLEQRQARIASEVTQVEPATEQWSRLEAEAREVSAAMQQWRQIIEEAAVAAARHITESRGRDVAV